MLLVVQFTQIARAVTTYESMRGNNFHGSRASEAITSALTAGTTSMEGAQMGGGGMGPSPTTPSSHQAHNSGKQGFFAIWKKLLGLDTFVATATGGLEPKNRSRRNPFSRGMVMNCKDFWCDAAPYFGKREAGAAMLDGEMINYTRMYETPPRMKLRAPRDGDGSMYHSVGDDEAV